MARLLLMVKTLQEDAERYWLTDELLCELSERGHDVHVLVFDRTGSHARRSWTGKGGINFHVFPMASWPNPFSLAGSIRWFARWCRAWLSAVRLLRENFDLIVNFSIASYFWGLSRVLKWRYKGCRSLLVLWDFFPRHHVEIGRVRGRLTERLLYMVESDELRSYEFIGVMSQRNEEYLRRYHPSHDAEVFILPVWGQASLIPRKRVRVPADPVNLVFGGQLAAGRGLDLIIRAAGFFAGRQDLKFIIVGDGPMRPWLEEEIAAKQLRNVDLKRSMSRGEYLRLLSESCDIGMVVTVPGVSVPTFPSKVVDFLRCGLPVLACVESSGDFGEVIEMEARCGLGVPAGDLEAFVKAIERLSFGMTEQERLEMGGRGQHYFRQHMTVESVARVLEEKCLKVMEKGE